MSEFILLDTDIGSDIDDAVALAYLLAHPLCELLGITTVTGEVQQRAALAEMLCTRAGKENIPIHCGRREVMVHGPGQPRVPQYEVVKQVPHRLDRPENSAVEFLRNTIRSRPGEVTLLSIGPLGNIATLFALDPEIPFLLKRFISMAGHFFDGARREWNVIVDPVAASIVYATTKKRHESVGLDVTLKCKMPASEVRERFKTPVLSLVAEMAEAWFSHSHELTFHDPLAAALIFQPELCDWVDGRVSVSMSNDHAQAGTTAFEEGPGPDRVAKTVDAGEFFDEYFKTTA